MTPDERRACLAARDAAQRTVDALDAILAAHADPGDMVPLAEACRAWGVTKDTALKRASRGLGRKVGGRWLVPAEAVARAEIPARPPRSNAD